LTLGPLGYDVDLARKALAGVGTDEFLLVELILGRPGHEIRWLKTGYRLKYGKDLTEVIKNDLSGRVERMFVMALHTQKPENEPYLDYARVETDVDALNAASKKKDETPFFEILINRSNAHLGAVIEKYGSKYKSLSKIIKKTFSGITERALLYIVHGVKHKRDRQGIWRDAKLLEATMAGLGTRDTQLIYRIVRAHWNPVRLEAVKTAYKNRYGKTLESRVKGETSGPYKDLLIDIITKTEPPKN
jgi:annexin A7/11